MLTTKNTLTVQRIRDFDKGLFFIVLALVFIGLGLIYSAGSARENLVYFQKQMIIAVAGIAIMVSMFTIPFSQRTDLQI